MFDADKYIEELTNSLKLTSDKYLFTPVNGIDDFENVITNHKNQSYFIACDGNQSGAIVRGAARGFFNRSPITVFICKTHPYKHQKNKNEFMAEFRAIHKSFITKLIKDRADNCLFLADLDRLPFYEIPGQFANGCIGIYFLFYVDDPVNLQYDESDWK
jgi:hypothetical protein